MLSFFDQVSHMHYDSLEVVQSSPLTNTCKQIFVIRFGCYLGLWAVLKPAQNLPYIKNTTNLVIQQWLQQRRGRTSSTENLSFIWTNWIKAEHASFSCKKITEWICTHNFTIHNCFYQSQYAKVQQLYLRHLSQQQCCRCNMERIFLNIILLITSEQSQDSWKAMDNWEYVL